jgi:hypothetical protein
VPIYGQVVKTLANAGFLERMDGLSAELSETRRARKQLATTAQKPLKLCHNARSHPPLERDWLLDSSKPVMKMKFILLRRNGVF